MENPEEDRAGGEREKERGKRIGKSLPLVSLGDRQEIVITFFEHDDEAAAATRRHALIINPSLNRFLRHCYNEVPLRKEGIVPPKAL